MLLLPGNRAWGRIPKTGSTALSRWLSANYNVRGCGAYHSMDLPEGEWQCFVTVRDPIERMGSWWAFDCHQRNRRQTLYKNKWVDNPAWGWTFEQWMTTRIMGDERTPPLYYPMSRWVDELDARVAHLETLDQDLKSLGFDRPMPVKMENVGTGKPYSGKFRDAVSDSDLQLILDYCPDDFERFGYEKP